MAPLPQRLITDTATTHLADHNFLHPQLWDAYKIQQADQDVASSVTLVDATDLLIAVASGDVWEIEAILRYSAAAAASDFKFDVVNSGGNIAGWYIPSGITPADAVPTAAPVLIAIAGAATITAVAAGTGAAHTDVRVAVLKGYFRMLAAGNFKVRFAQNTSNAGATRLHAGSVLRGRKLSV